MFSHRTLLNLRNLINSELLYASFTGGDGNFHAQQKKSVPNKFNNPSLVGATGFWPNEDTFNKYIKSRGAAVEDDSLKVRRAQVGSLSDVPRIPKPVTPRPRIPFDRQLLPHSPSQAYTLCPAVTYCCSPLALSTYTKVKDTLLQTLDSSFLSLS